ncbi:hypothetical protein [Methylobacterium nodulans]|uniref:Uncharacterized protein n=1 Tax=Methylobacterium nodulans (strain LMG 21967 / CNCM I-2342 / ORS 2060) TaxID=460265 RepID=B8INX3_METNO|nr:hypothetical protein [Methylobacterium nodulans]ACL58489.1 hypothetical protein Mnod_3580 [Methylobacterium nodulans ORS 2060]
MSAPYSLPWSLGSVEHANGDPVADTTVIWLSNGGTIEVEETKNAGRIANLILAAPDLLDALHGDPDCPEISPLSWLKSLIDHCKERGPKPDEEDPDAWFTMVREAEELHRKGTAAVSKAEGRS